MRRLHFLKSINGLRRTATIDDTGIKPNPYRVTFYANGERFTRRHYRTDEYAQERARQWTSGQLDAP